ncbi:uncharacterized protein P884DRAFT_302821 [Thermothelomyces heterothallicus CBS 202.75]|uniref:uncharacterized protein n=1 Tax=Thermothelomyces heterothallicus CBS 202.75 TaxID=1149848 RepID=UPI0037430723
MDQLPTPLVPSASIPLLQGMRLRFVQVLKDKKSFWVLTTMFPRFVSELERLPKIQNIKLDETTGMLSRMGGPATPGDVWDILHSIPRNVLESLVLGTVAFDSNRSVNRLRGLSSDGAGVYVAGLSIAGRGGKFLNLGELKVLIMHLERYIAGYKASVSQSAGNQQTPAAIQALDLVARVDAAYGGQAVRGTPRFITDEISLEAAAHLVASFKSRYNIMREKDPTAAVYMVQSPQYVGCSKELPRRMNEYQLTQNRRALGNINKFLALTVSLLRYQGLSPRIDIVPAVRVWKDRQLPKAEMLVAALAGAYVTQDGFNLREAGGNNPSIEPHKWLAYEQYTFLEVSYLNDNLEQSAEDLEKVKKIMEYEEIVKELDDGSLQQRADKCLADAEEIRNNVQILRDLNDKISRARVEQEKAMIALNEQGRNLAMVKDLLLKLQEVAREQIAKRRNTDSQQTAPS